MNLVFITSSVEPHDGREGATKRDLVRIAPYVIAAGVGGSVSALVVYALGLAARRLDPTPGALLLKSFILILALVVIDRQRRGVVSPLPERRRQVPRRWLLWKWRWLTAVGYGFVLGNALFTHLRYAAVYSLALLIVLAPTIAAALVAGGLYGVARGGTLLWTWHMRRHGRLGEPGLGPHARGLLVSGALAVPLWLTLQFVI
jgi:hypothetical protein